MNKINTKLLKHKKKTITLDELMVIFDKINRYEDFYQAVKKLMDRGVLEGIPASGVNGRPLSLFNKYRLKKTAVEVDKSFIINEKIFTLHSLLSLDYYFAKELNVFKEDEPYIDKINEYIVKNGLPKNMLVPELSYELVSDEKWIEKGTGMKILKRLGLWTRLDPIKEPDPVSFAVNKKLINKKKQRHLIVENKTPFLHLLSVIEESNYNTVIYGQGWKITSGLDLFARQYSFGETNEFFYFGDIDNEGISIFLNLEEKYKIKPALDFYQSLYSKPWSKGKINQRYDKEKILGFIESLRKIPMTQNSDRHVQDLQYIKTQPDYILTMLTDGFYQPQEILTREETEKIVKQGVKDD